MQNIEALTWQQEWPGCGWYGVADTTASAGSSSRCRHLTSSCEQSWLLLMPCKIDPIKRSVRNSCEHCYYEGPERAGRGTWWCHQCSGQWCDRGDEESGRWTFGILQCSDISHFSIVKTFWDKRSQRSVQTLSLCMASKELTSERWSSRWDGEKYIFHFKIWMQKLIWSLLT